MSINGHTQAINGYQCDINKPLMTVNAQLISHSWPLMVMNAHSWPLRSIIGTLRLVSSIFHLVWPRGTKVRWATMTQLFSSFVYYPYPDSATFLDLKVNKQSTRIMKLFKEFSRTYSLLFLFCKLLGVWTTFKLYMCLIGSLKGYIG